ncbi:hypothetical protein BVRB_6g130870 [Beta vulgaris subsp. vulgaris]|nr:hypothetical protein BVRB_6g130870 [Beta vulgaris subsp. vulgaris]
MLINSSVILEIVIELVVLQSKFSDLNLRFSSFFR